MSALATPAPAVDLMANLCRQCRRHNGYKICESEQEKLQHIQDHIDKEALSSTAARLHIVQNCFPQFLTDNGIDPHEDFHKQLGTNTILTTRICRVRESSYVKRSVAHGATGINSSIMASIPSLDELPRLQQPIGKSFQRRRKAGTKRAGLCDICEKYTKDVMTHLQSHRDLSVLCPHCGFRVKNKSGLQCHIEAKHDQIRNYECDICLHKFYKPSSLVKHVRTIHTKRPVQEKNHICDDCGRHFRTAYYVALHQRNHWGLLPYICDECGALFGHPGTLERHGRMHNDKRDYGCDDCGRQCRDREQLRAHISIHTGERSFQCQVCDQAFRVRVMLGHHKRRFNHFW